MLIKVCVFPCRLDFHLEAITQVASTPAWTLTVTRILIRSLIVSVMDPALLHLRSVLFYFIPWCFSWCIFMLNSFSSAAGRGGEECMSHCSSGGFPDSSRMVTVSNRQPYWYWWYHIYIFDSCLTSLQRKLECMFQSHASCASWFISFYFIALCHNFDFDISPIFQISAYVQFVQLATLAYLNWNTNLTVQQIHLKVEYCKSQLVHNHYYVCLLKKENRTCVSVL